MDSSRHSRAGGNPVSALITDNIDVWTSAIKKRNSQGRGANKKIALTGIKKLRELILELAVRGKLVPQDANDEPASVLFEKTAEEKEKLIAAKNIKSPKPLLTITDDEKTFELPSSWRHVRLGEVGYWAIGSGFPKAIQGEVNKVVLVSKVSDMNLEGNEKYIVSSNNSVDFVTAENSRLKIHREGTVIFPKIGGAIATNKRRIIIKPTVIDNNCLGITPYCCFESEYLFLYMSSIDLTKYQVGTSVPALSQSVLELITLGLPPLAEQHRIVAKVDELMALCDQLEQQTEQSLAAHQTLVTVLLAALTDSASAEEFQTSWQRIAEHFDVLFTTEHSIEQLKQTILQLAVMGKLVPQNPSDEPASVLLEKIAEEKSQLIKDKKIKKQKSLPAITDEEKPFELPSDWEWSRIIDAALFTEYGTSEKAFEGTDGVPVLKMGDIQSGKVLHGGQKVVPSTIDDLPNLYLDYGDVLYNRTNSAELVGKTGMFEGDSGCYTFASYLIRIRCHFQCVTPQYLTLSMNTPLFRRTQIDPYVKQQCGQANVNGTLMKSMIVSLPPLAEQDRIVAKVDELMALCEQLKARLSDAQTTQLHLADAVVENALT
jgi:type I restriction enzyme S subunit